MPASPDSNYTGIRPVDVLCAKVFDGPLGWYELTVRDNPRASLANDAGTHWSYPSPRLWFVDHMGTRYAVIESSADDALSRVEYAERFQAWR